MQNKMSKKGAIEMSINTVIVIVLGMTLLAGGIIFVNKIITGAVENVGQVDDITKKEISKLFSDNPDRSLVLYPSSAIVKLKQGSQDTGFAISIKNVDPQATKTYSYRVVFDSPGSCQTINSVSAGSKAQIIVGATSNGIVLGPGKSVENPPVVRFAIAGDAPKCTFRVRTEVSTAGSIVASDFMDVQIV